MSYAVEFIAHILCSECGLELYAPGLDYEDEELKDGSWAYHFTDHDIQHILENYEWDWVAGKFYCGRCRQKIYERLMEAEDED